MLSLCFAYLAGLFTGIALTLQWALWVRRRGVGTRKKSTAETAWFEVCDGIYQDQK